MVANADQLDTDNDLQGNVCDSDDDGDSVLDYADAFPLDPDKSEDRGLSTMLNNLTTAVATKGLDSPAMLQTLTESLVRNLPALRVTEEEIEQTYSETIVQATTSVVMENETENLDSLLGTLSNGVVQGAKQISTVNVDIASIAQVTSESLTTTAAEEDSQYVVPENLTTDLTDIINLTSDTAYVQILGSNNQSTSNDQFDGVLYADIKHIHDLDISRAVEYQWFANEELMPGYTDVAIRGMRWNSTYKNKSFRVEVSYYPVGLSEKRTLSSDNMAWGNFYFNYGGEPGNGYQGTSNSDGIRDIIIMPDYQCNNAKALGSYLQYDSGVSEPSNEADCHSIKTVHQDDVGVTAREGEHLIEFSAKEISNRTELGTGDTHHWFFEGEDIYFAYSLYLPKEEWDPITKYSTIITQLRQFGMYEGPNFGLRLSNEGDHKLIMESMLFDDYPYIATLKPDQWHDIKIHSKQSKGNDGEVNIWIDNQLAWSYDGPTMYYSDDAGYISFGMYTEIRDDRKFYVDVIEQIDHLYRVDSLEEWNQQSPGDNPTSPDTNAPTFQTATTSNDGTKVLLTYSETLSSTTAAASDFTLEVDGSAATISGVATSGSTVELTLTNAFKNDQTVTVAYADPTSSNDTNAIQDTAGNDAASLSDTIVTSNSTAGTSATTKLFATQDASIKENSSTNGNWSKNEVYGGSTPVIAFVEFDLNSFSQGDGIQSATFRPYVRTLKNNQSSKFSTYSTTSKEWSQSSVQWSTRPLKDQLLNTVTISASGSYVDFDVTSAIQASINSGQSRVTLWIEDSQNEDEGFEFDSVNKNPSYPNEPKLVDVTG